MKPSVLAALVAASLFGAAAHAQTVEKKTTTVQRTDPVTGAKTTTRTTTRTEFAQLDTDADGFVVVTEVPRDDAFATVFTTYDADRDQRITRIEYDAYLAAKPVATTTTRTTTTTSVPAFTVLDVDADGYIVVDDLPADNEFRTVWVDYDKDGDKRITRIEYEPYYTVHVVDDDD